MVDLWGHAPGEAEKGRDEFGKLLERAAKNRAIITLATWNMAIEAAAQEAEDGLDAAVADLRLWEYESRNYIELRAQIEFAKRIALSIRSLKKPLDSPHLAPDTVGKTV